MGSFAYRLMGAILLDAGAYENIEADRRATVQAAGVVVLSSVAAGIGAAGIYGPSLHTLGIVTGIALASWVAWAMLIFHIGSRWLPEPATSVTVTQLLGTIGFAAAPGLLQALALFPGLSGAAFIVAWLWMLIAMVVAVKHALDFRSTARAIAVCVLAAGLSLAMAVGLSLVFGPELS